MKVVLGGSRHLSFLPEDAIDSLSAWMRDDAHFLLGDASGTDAKFQEFLAHKHYEHVTIYFSGDFARHNLGGWQSEHIDSGLKSKGHAMHTAKDRDMTKMANTGLMIWDTASPGTIANVIDLLTQGKPCQLFVAGNDANLYHFAEPEDLAVWEDRHPEVFEESHKRLVAHAKRVGKREPSAQDTLF